MATYLMQKINLPMLADNNNGYGFYTCRPLRANLQALATRGAPTTPEQETFIARLAAEAQEWYVASTKEGIIRYVLTVRLFAHHFRFK